MTNVLVISFTKMLEYIRFSEYEFAACLIFTARHQSTRKDRNFAGHRLR